MISPKSLKVGDKVALISPASSSTNENLKKAVQSIKKMGLEPVIYESCYSNHGHLSGVDQLRAHDINQAFADKSIKGILCLRGGSGAYRLLDLIDYNIINENPKFFLGYSDITTLHISINQRAKLITYHGPMPGSEWIEGLDEFTEDSLKMCMFKNDDAYDFSNNDFECFSHGEAKGRLIGGNLSLIVSTLGTPYEIDTKGKILFIEEVGEAYYKIDRMFTSLALAGKFADAEAIILGTFNKCYAEKKSTGFSDLSLMEIIKETIAPCNKPILTNYPAGHVKTQVTLPLGECIKLNTHERKIFITQDSVNPPLLRTTHVEINKQHLKHNYNIVKALLKPDVLVLVVVKANGYGHGLIEVAELFWNAGANIIGVATLSEALKIKNYNKSIEVLVMGHTPDEYLATAVNHNCILTISTLEQGKLLSNIGNARVHLKVDTGFHRLGMSWKDDGIEIATELLKVDNISVEGIFSHIALSNAEEDYVQFERFIHFTESLKKKGITIPTRHICDSIASTRYPDFQLDMVRLGAILYGMQARDQKLPVREAFSLKSKISNLVYVKAGEGVSYDYMWRAKEDTLIATIPIGYADGYPRSMTHNGIVSIRGQHVKVAGIICMDQMMVDVTGISNVIEGDEVLLYDFEAELPISKIAELCKTNKNEILTRITDRVPRIYKD